MSHNNNVESSAPDKLWELEKQLHEQYATNSNEHIKIFITIITSLFALFGGYGYLFAHASNELSGLSGENPYGAESFLLVSIIVCMLLTLLSCLCVFLGYAERRDQIQNKYIRDKYGFTTVYSNPKGRNYLYYLASYYRLFFQLIFISQVIIIVSTIIKCLTISGLWFWVPLVIEFVFLLITFYYKIKYYLNYRRMDLKPVDGVADTSSYTGGKNYCIISNGDCVCYRKKIPKDQLPQNKEYGIGDATCLEHLFYIIGCTMKRLLRRHKECPLDKKK